MLENLLWKKVLNNLNKFIIIRNDYAEKSGNYCKSLYK